MVFKICEGKSCSSFYVKEFDVLVHKTYFPFITPLNFWDILYPNSLANLVVEVGTRHSHQILLSAKVPSGDGPISQIPQCIRQISHNATFCNRNVHMCTFLLQNAALWDMGIVHPGICEVCLLLWLPQNLMDNESTLVQVMAWCRQKTHPAIIWTNVGLFSIGLLGKYFREILIKIKHFSFKKKHF